MVVVEKAGGASTLSVKVLVVVPPSVSCRVTVKVLCPDPVGVPVMAPVVGFRARPAGSEPPVTE